MGLLRRSTTAAIAAVCALLALAPQANAIKHSRWLDKVRITEYWPARESWGVGRKVPAPGTGTSLRVDFLYGGWGMSMEGDGLGEDGRRYHIESAGPQGWVTADGRPTIAASGFPQGAPYWRSCGWRNKHREVTFPLAAGGWSNGKARKYHPCSPITFARGPSLDLKFWRSVAVDPDVIPLGSWVWVPQFRNQKGNGWMRAQDTGGAIQGHSIDVYREPPSDPSGGESYSGARIYVVPPGEPKPGGKPPKPHR